MPQISTGKLLKWSLFKGDNRAAKTDNSRYCPICLAHLSQSNCDHRMPAVSQCVRSLLKLSLTIRSAFIRGFNLTLNAPIATKVVCFSRLPKCLRSLYGEPCGPRTDCSYRSSLFWVHTVCFYTYFLSIARQLFAADDFSRQHFRMHFLFGALKVKF